jgi:hypothetical protein
MLKETLLKLKNDLPREKFFNPQILISYIYDFAPNDKVTRTEVQKYKMLTQGMDIFGLLNHSKDYKVTLINIQKQYNNLGFSDVIIDWILDLTTSILDLSYEPLTHKTVRHTIPAPNTNSKKIKNPISNSKKESLAGATRQKLIDTYKSSDENVQKGIDAFFNKRYSISEKLLKEKAKYGDYHANLFLGLIKLYGLNNNTSITAALKYFEMSGVLKNNSLLFPDVFDYVPAKAFSDEKSLKKIILGENIKEIGNAAFMGSRLESITILGPVKEIPSNCFKGSNFLEIIHLPSSVNQISNSAFRSCIRLEKIILPDNINTIKDYAFAECRSLKNINIPNNLEILGKGTFKFCNALKNITFNNQLKYIPDNLFENCKSLFSVDLPDNLLTIMPKAFINCINLQEIAFPKTLNSIGNQAFYSCKRLNVKYPSDIKNIGHEAFAGTKVSF